MVFRQALTNFRYLSAQLIYFVLCNFSIIAAVKTGSLYVALLGLPGKLSKFNNTGWLTGILHVTSLSIQTALNCSSPNFEILEISSYTISLKVTFSLLSTVNLFNLNGLVKVDVFNQEL